MIRRGLDPGEEEEEPGEQVEGGPSQDKGTGPDEPPSEQLQHEQQASLHGHPEVSSLDNVLRC